MIIYNWIRCRKEVFTNFLYILYQIVSFKKLLYFITYLYFMAIQLAQNMWCRLLKVATQWWFIFNIHYIWDWPLWWYVVIFMIKCPHVVWVLTTTFLLELVWLAKRLSEPSVDQNEGGGLFINDKGAYIRSRETFWPTSTEEATLIDLTPIRGGAILMMSSMGIALFG